MPYYEKIKEYSALESRDIWNILNSLKTRWRP